ncbi:hypothetical protein FGB62_4g431 [Gracilaria domingensis]|nr:hypothetical protein FGB62_4g431 [Gracilaria domingensis]
MFPRGTVAGSLSCWGANIADSYLKAKDEAYNYNTTSDEDPRNLILLATTQGLTVQADGAGKKRLLHHARDASTKTSWHHWLEAERSDHALGGPQVESVEERKDAKRRKKDTAEVLGIKAMGKRFSTLMTAQIPVCRQVVSSASSDDGEEEESMPLFSTECHPKRRRKVLAYKAARKGAGISTAARVSRGTKHGIFSGLKLKEPRRNINEHVTVPVVFYNTDAAGVPAAEDISAAEDIERLLRACSQSGRLRNAAFRFIKQELKVSDMIQIAGKVTTQPRASTATDS